VDSLPEKLELNLVFYFNSEGPIHLGFVFGDLSYDELPSESTGEPKRSRFGVGSSDCQRAFIPL